MPRQGVDACADELVTLLLDSLRRVVEVRAGRRHGRATHQLSEDDQYQADGDGGEVDEASLIRRNKNRDHNLGQISTMGNVVRRAVAEQQEAAGACLG